MKTQILPPSPKNIARAAHAIQQDNVVGMPTETVYGLAGNAWSPTALSRIFNTKDRPKFDPLIIHIDKSSGTKGTQRLSELSLIDSAQILPSMRDRIDLLIDQFWPGPLTLILPKHPDVPDLATSGLSTVALRMPQHPVAQALISAAGCPLAAPSANRFGRISPTTPEAVLEELDGRILWILDGGPCEIGVESTIIGFNEEQDLCVFRPGGTPIESIEKVLQQNILIPSQKSILSPGMLESHYSPKKTLKLLPTSVLDLTTQNIEEIQSQLKHFQSPHAVGLLLMKGNSQFLSSHLSQAIHRPVIAETLSPSNQVEEAAHQLFSQMRKLDSSDVAVIYSEPCVYLHGLGHAIRDRLKRASS